LVYWGLITPALTLILFSRYGGQLSSWLANLVTKPFGRQRSGRTDIRTVSQTLPDELKETYNPERFFSPKKVFSRAK